MEKLFVFFFKYPPFHFRNGDLNFQWVLSPWLAGAVLVVALAMTFLLYRSQIRRFAGRQGWFLLALRLALVTMIVGLLMRPTLTLPTMAPREGIAAILVDNSKSMGLRTNGQARGERVKDLLANGSDFLQGLKDNFHLKQYRFDSSAGRLEDPMLLDWSGDQTDLVGGLEKVLTDSKNLPLNGIILFSDGADNSMRDGGQVLAQLQRQGIPIHTVGIGPSRLERDVELVQVRAPRHLLPDTAAVARVTLRQTGFGGSEARLEVREAGTLLDSTAVQFPRDSDTTYAELRLLPTSEGVRVYDFRLVPLESEQITANNSRSTVVQVSDSRPRILYVDGQPRWEFKFLRRALSDDRYIRFETFLRTALNKFYRQGIEEETVLAGGFPTKKEELYQYQAILIGNVESAFFSYSQMELLRDFVGHRGGGFLMLGGNSTLSSGGYQNTPVEEMLPVWLEEKASTGAEADYQRGRSGAVLTAYGANHPALELGRDGKGNGELWRGLPDLIDRNRVRGLKPGATVLIQLQSEVQSDWSGEPLLISQRYGKGLAAAFLSGSSWRWQMLLDHEDRSHETFWKQIVRWLVLSAEEPVTVETEREVYSQRELVSIRAEVRDAAFSHVNNARIEASVISPESEATKVAFRWDSREDGVYFGEWSPQSDGLHQIHLEAFPADNPQESLGRARTFFTVATGAREYFDSTLKEDYLRHLSEQTGGRYYSADDAGRLPSEVRYVESQASVIEVLELWDMPVNLLLLFSLLFMEWFLRRRWGTL